MQELLGSQQVVRVRVPRDASTAAIDILSLIGTATVGVPGAPEPDRDAVWLSVPAAPNRAAEINRLLASGRVYASGLESGSDLEMLFLELTGGEPVAGSEGTFQGIGTASR